MRRLIVLLLALLLTAPLTIYAQSGESTAPESASPEAAPTAPAPVHHKKKRRHHRRHHHRTETAETTVEPASARLKIKNMDPIYERASSHSKHIGTLTPGMFVQVIGSTRSFLQVQLKDGKIGFISPKSVYLVTPQDKQFLLTANSPVYSVPNQWGEKLAEVHRGKYVHVIGSALSYVKIRMKNGTEGYVPMAALQ